MIQSLKGVNRWHIAAIACLAFAVFMAGTNRVPVPTVDGAVRASMARNIVVDRSLYPITYEGKVFIDHPPLFVWLTALSYKIFGITDFAANVVPRLFAFLAVLVTGLIALEAGFSAGIALASALVLCLTRDFVLSSVRGYIEPLLTFFFYLAYWLVLRQRHREGAPWLAAAAGVAVWLSAFSKGPVALWPLLFCGYLLANHAPSTSKAAARALSYAGAFTLCTLLWIAWVSARNDWPYWHEYLYKQVLSSALRGRDGAQQLEPLYFVKILAKFYWPWVPLLLWAIARLAGDARRRFSAPGARTRCEFLILGLGFIGGFSLMRWKLWYYIAPAYPAFALLIASSLERWHSKVTTRQQTARIVFAIGLAWVAAASLLPIRLHRERVPEVMAFKDTIANSSVPGPVWYVRDPMDHNLIGTSGMWYFDRVVEKITDDREGEWSRSQLKAPAWIITGREYFEQCHKEWCNRSRLIQSAGRSSLVYFPAGS